MNKNSLHQNGFIVPALLGVIAVLIIGGGFYVYKNKKAEAPVVVNEDQKVNPDISIADKVTTDSNQVKNIESKKISVDNTQVECLSTLPSIKVLSPNGGETFTLGQTINIKWNSKCIDSNKIVSLNIGIKDSQAVSELLSKEVTNSGSYDFVIPSNYNLSGYTSNKYDISIGYVYGNGDGVNDQSDTPFSITGPEQPKTMTVKVYYPNNVFNPGLPDCSVVYPLERTIPHTQSVATAAFTELAKGPTEAEVKMGYLNVIPEGAKINSISITNGVAYVDFNKKIEDNFTSCSGASRLSATGKTFKQFQNIKEVKYSVEGNSNQYQIFQP